MIHFVSLQMFQIMFHEKALYIRASNCVDAKEWIDILSRICVSNQNRLRDYHPSAFIGNQWLWSVSCCPFRNPAVLIVFDFSCHQVTESASGCCPVSKSLPSDIAVHIDSDREVARIHSLLLNQMEVIDDLLLMTTKDQCYELSTKVQSQMTPSLLIEDIRTFDSTLRDLKSIVMKLDADQKTFLKKEWNDTIYGSEKAPIGDTAYLSLFAQQVPSQESKPSDLIKRSDTS